MNTGTTTSFVSNSMSTHLHCPLAPWPFTFLAALALALTVPARADWSPLGSGMNNSVDALAVSGTNLYAGGTFTTAGGVPASYIAKWNGSAWSALGSGMSGGTYVPYVYALAVSGTNLYAGGDFTYAGGVRVNYIAKWDGSTWSALGSGMNGSVSGLAVSGTNLYAGGNFTMAGGVPANYIAKWDGTSWSALGLGMNNAVRPLAVSGTDLYAGGVFTTAGGVPANYIAKWDGTAWSPLGSGVSGGDLPGVHALALIGTNLYTGGYISGAGGLPVNCIAKWDGSAWSALDSGLGGVGGVMPNLIALMVSGTDLYVGGIFTSAGGVPAKYIAKWDGSAWSALGSGMGGTYPDVDALAADGAGHLFVGGWFSLAGTNVCPYIAQANLPVAPIILASPQTQTAEAGANVDFAADVTGRDLSYQWLLNSTNPISWGTNSDLLLTNVQFPQSGTYTLVVINDGGTVTSAPALLNVIAPVARRPVPGVNLMAQAGTFLGLDYRDNLGPTANWATMVTMTLSNSSQFYFDLSSPLPPHRFYRAWRSGTPGVAPSLSLPTMVPAITLTGNIGDSLRLDYINQFGPTDAWLALDTVTLTNTSHLYFDTSSIGQPARLWRIVPVP